MGFSRQEYWDGLPCPPPGDLSDPGIKPVCPALQADSLLLSHLGSPNTSFSHFSCSVVSKFCDLMDCSTPIFPVHHQFLEPAQTHVHQVDDAIQTSHPLSFPCPPAFNLSYHHGLFLSHFFTSGGQRIGASTSASVLPINIQD